MDRHLYDDAYVKLVKPIMRRNWDKYKDQSRKDKELRSFILWVVAIFMIVVVGIFIVRLVFISTADYTERRHDYAKLGDSNYYVYRVQDALADNGYKVTVDSVFGPETLEALLSWQRSNHMEETGVIDALTLDSLDIHANI